MKFILNYFLAAALLFLSYGCGKDNSIVESDATGEYSALKIKGEVSGWNMGSGVELKFIDETNPGYILASGKISGGGSFAISVPAPAKAELKSIARLSENELSISDPSAKYLIASPAFYANGELFGVLEWNSELYGGTVKPEYCKAVYFYSDKEVTVSGASYGFTAQAGWNTLYVYRDESANFYYSDEADTEGSFTAYGLVK